MNLEKNFRREVLDNGVTLLFEKRDFPVASISISSRIGAVYESKKEKGLTHFMEHLLLKGTKNKDGLQFVKEIEGAGGEFNAFTSNISVKVWIKSPDNFIERGLDILIDIVKNSLFKKEALTKERKVIVEEIDMVNDEPREYASEKMDASLYSEPFSLPLLGTKENLKRFKRKDLLKKYKEVFSPENLIVCVVGKYSFEKLKKKIEKNFMKNFPIKSELPKIEKKTSQIIERKKGFDQSRLIFSFHSPLSSDKQIFASNVLYNILNGGISSRLYSRLRYKEAIIYENGGGVISSKDFSFTYFDFGCSEKNIPKIKKIILEELKDVSKNLNEKELQFVKDKINGDYKVELESCEEEETSLVFSEIETGNAHSFYGYPKKIQEVKLEEVKKLAKEVAEGNYGTFILIPKK